MPVLLPPPYCLLDRSLLHKGPQKISGLISADLGGSVLFSRPQRASKDLFGVCVTDNRACTNARIRPKVHLSPAVLGKL